MPEERFQTETILRETTVDVERPVELDTDGTAVETETLELPTTERVEVVTCERYPAYCPRRDGYVPIEEAVVVGVDTVDRATGTDSAIALAYCPECAASEFDYVRERDDPLADDRTLHEKYGYLFGADDRAGIGNRSAVELKAETIRLVTVLAVLGALMATIGVDGLLLWGVLVVAAATSAVRAVAEGLPAEGLSGRRRR